MGTDTCVFAGDFFLLVMGEVLYACGRACELKMGEKESGRVYQCALMSRLKFLRLLGCVKVGKVSSRMNNVRDSPKTRAPCLLQCI